MAVINGTRGNDRIIAFEIRGLPIVSHDTIHGLQGHDYIDGGEGDDTLYGDEGNDVLIGGLGTNHLYGGLGDDRMIGGKGTDHFDGGAGNKPADAGSDTVSYENAKGVIVKLNGGIGTGGDALGDTYVNIENIDGSDYADELIGDGGANILRGLKGDDELSGLGGVDTLRGGEGRDRLYGGQQGDFLYGDEGNDILTADSGFVAEAAIDRLDGGAGDDTLTGSSGDIFAGGAGNDAAVLRLARSANAFSVIVADPALTSTASDGTSFTGVEKLHLYLTDRADTVQFGAGDDLAYAYLGNDVIRGGDGADTIHDGSTAGGTAANSNSFYGEAGADRLVGGDKGDLLNGGAGADILSGGGSTAQALDVFEFDFADIGSGAADTITDFVSSVDQIRFNSRFQGEHIFELVFIAEPDPRANLTLFEGEVYFLYDTDDGRLYYAEYPEFGFPLGPELFAILDGGPALSQFDIDFVF